MSPIGDIWLIEATPIAKCHHVVTDVGLNRNRAKTYRFWVHLVAHGALSVISTIVDILVARNEGTIVHFYRFQRNKINQRRVDGLCSTWDWIACGCPATKTFTIVNT